MLPQCGRHSLARSLGEQDVFPSEQRVAGQVGRKREPVLHKAGSHYFHVADWGMERGGIMSRRYSRWRSTAEEVLCTVKLGLTNASAPPATEQSNRLRWSQSGLGSQEDTEWANQAWAAKSPPQN